MSAVKLAKIKIKSNQIKFIRHKIFLFLRYLTYRTCTQTHIPTQRCDQIHDQPPLYCWPLIKIFCYHQ